MKSYPERILPINVHKLANTHTFVHTLTKEILKGTPPFLCGELSGVQSINPACCRYILQSLYVHCKSTHFLIFLLKILKNCDNLMLLGTRSHTFGPRNEIDTASCLTEFTLRLCNASFRRKLYGRETGTNISFKMNGEKPFQTLNVNLNNKFLHVSMMCCAGLKRLMMIQEKI